MHAPHSQQRRNPRVSLPRFPASAQELIRVREHRPLGFNQRNACLVIIPGSTMTPWTFGAVRSSVDQTDGTRPVFTDESSRFCPAQHRLRCGHCRPANSPITRSLSPTLWAASSVGNPRPTITIHWLFFSGSSFSWDTTVIPRPATTSIRDLSSVLRAFARRTRRGGPWNQPPQSSSVSRPKGNHRGAADLNSASILSTRMFRNARSTSAVTWPSQDLVRLSPIYNLTYSRDVIARDLAPLSHLGDLVGDALGRSLNRSSPIRMYPPVTPSEEWLRLWLMSAFSAVKEMSAASA